MRTTGPGTALASRLSVPASGAGGTSRTPTVAGAHAHHATASRATRFARSQSAVEASPAADTALASTNRPGPAGAASTT
ncbi:MAG TPA: hypothetical protein VNN07_14590, partial [Candidatus Tectomicrobia bacterium]|nr:hypothetical protein [Candidatus Tectomicrobia bacterium]